MLSTIIKIISIAAKPEVIAAVKSILATLAQAKQLLNDKGQLITETELDAIWAQARADFQTLGSEAAASNAALGKLGDA